jgi:hypothetical protein
MTGKGRDDGKNEFRTLYGAVKMDEPAEVRRSVMPDSIRHPVAIEDVWIPAFAGKTEKAGMPGKANF